jgi:hypothetical protein
MKTCIKYLFLILKLLAAVTLGSFLVAFATSSYMDFDVFYAIMVSFLIFLTLYGLYGRIQEISLYLSKGIVIFTKNRTVNYTISISIYFLLFLILILFAIYFNIIGLIFCDTSVEVPTDITPSQIEEYFVIDMDKTLLFNLLEILLQVQLYLNFLTLYLFLILIILIFHRFIFSNAKLTAFIHQIFNRK